MRRSLRIVLVVLALLVVPGANAREEVQCLPGNFVFYGGGLGYRCTFTEEGTHCLLCSYTIEVRG